MSHADMNNCCGFNEAAAAFSWNSPKKAINPYLDPAEVAPVSALSNLITLYAADNEQEQLRREALSDQVWERYFFNESRDPVQREMEQDKLISRAKLAHEQQRFNPDMVILADVNAQPSHISKPLMQRIEYFSSLGRPKAYSRYLRETIKPCLERLEHVRDSQLSTSFRFMASHEGLDGLLILPEMSQDQVKRLSTLVAAHMSMCLDAACGDLYATDDVKPEEIRKTWEKVAAETLRLDVIPPAFEQLRRKRNRRKPVPYELIPGSLARMLCADWWYRKLWKMRCEWREEQLRAVCLVSKKASPYAAIVKLADPRVALRLARQQVNFFEIFPFFMLLHDELAVACGGGELHLIQRPIVTPLVAFFPAVNGCNFLAQHFSNAGYAVSLKVQQHGLPMGIEICGCQCGVHGTNLQP